MAHREANNLDQRPFWIGSPLKTEENVGGHLSGQNVTVTMQTIFVEPRDVMLFRERDELGLCVVVTSHLLAHFHLQKHPKKGTS